MLDDILMSKQQDVVAAKERLPFEELKTRMANHLADRSFRKAVNQPGKLSLIAELKRKSPSKGMLRERFDPVHLGQSLQEAGASALSVLTDEPFFGGHVEFLRDVHQFVEVPCLRKDFVIDPYQVYEAAVYEADAVLLIARILEPETLSECLQAADTLGLEPFVEVHSLDELKLALSLGAHVVGINARDLETLQLNPTLIEQLITHIPSGKTIVAESGLQTPEDLKRMKALGVHAVLIGEALMTAPDPVVKVQELFASVW